MAAECADGIGGDAFYNIFKSDRDSANILRKIEAIPRDKTEPDQWQAQIFARILAKYKVIFISSMPDDIVCDFHMIPAHSVDEAVIIADGILGRKSGITVIPEGISCIIKE